MGCSKETEIMKATVSSCLAFVKDLKTAKGLRGVLIRWLGGTELDNLIAKLEQSVSLKCGGP